MVNDDPPEIPPELGFLSDCLLAIHNQEYGNAIIIMKSGLEGLSSADISLNAKQLSAIFYILILHLERKLKEAYGEQWERSVETPEIADVKEVVRCSFCGKGQGEVRKIIAGAGVFICDGCVGICNRILESESLLDPRGGRA